MIVWFFFLAGVGLVLLSNFVFHVMLGEVNGRSSPDKQISMWGMDIVKFMRVWDEHHRLYPESRKDWHVVGFFLLGLALSLVAAFLFLGRGLF